MDKQQEIKIELTPEVAKGIYSNLAVITHGPNEFFVDFITMAPNMSLIHNSRCRRSYTCRSR
ncbi:MAG: DUF3467 domain-containing protein, partial [Duncaniella sp.]|nr:DUF3467 domain-containing protein [Duncaniella sp.]